MLRRIFPIALFAFALALFGTVAHADTITVVGSETGNQATATVVCEFNSQTNTFTFTITNTSAITSPGSMSTITSIGFDLPPAGNASPSGLNGFTGSQAPTLGSSFVFSDAAVGRVPGFKGVTLDFAFLTGRNFGGGSPDLGLDPGESASFTVSGAAFTGFTEEQICNAIYVRFQDVGEFAEDSDVGTQGPAPTASITIIKDAQPNSPDSFSFTATGQVNQNFSLTDNGIVGPDRITFSNLTGFGRGNSVTITEASSGDYNLVAINCVSNANGGSGVNNNTINVQSRFATIQLEEGESVVCTFVNALPATGRIEIIQQANPESSAVFGFTGTNGISPFSLADDGNDNDATPNNIYFDVPPGQYTIEQMVPQFAEALANLSCSAVLASGVITSGRSATISLLSLDTVTCTYTNTLTIIP